MATADSVREKIEQLISDANAATGNTDADLTTAVNALIAGYGQGGDTSVEDAIITRTITEYSSDRVTSIGKFAFYEAKSLVTVNVPNVTTINERAFDLCIKLETINIPNEMTLEYSAFWNCRSLKSVDFLSIKRTHYNVFGGCTNLRSLILRANSISNIADTGVFDNTPIKSGTGYIYVPYAVIDTYKSATNWVVFADQFRALEDYTVDGTTTGELDESKVNA